MSAGLRGQRRIDGERLCGHTHCSKKAGTKKESSAVHMYLPLVIYAGQFDPIGLAGFVFKVSDDPAGYYNDLNSFEGLEDRLID